MTRVKNFALACTLLAGTVALAATSAPQGQTTPPPQTQTPPPKPATPPAQTPAAPKPAPAPVPFPADARIGYVNMQAVVSESKLGKCGQEQMKALLDQHSKDVADINKQIQAQQQKMQAQSGVVTEAVQQQMQRELDRLQRDGQAKVADNQAREKELNDDLLQRFQDVVIPIVEKLRSGRNLWMIFTVSQDSNVAAAQPGLDLSAELTKLLDDSQPNPCPKKAGGGL